MRLPAECRQAVYMDMRLLNVTVYQVQPLYIYINYITMVCSDGPTKIP